MESIALVRQLSHVKNLALDVAFILPEQPSSSSSEGIERSGLEISSSSSLLPNAASTITALLSQQHQQQSLEIQEAYPDEEAKDSSSYIRRTLSGRNKSKLGVLVEEVGTKMEKLSGGRQLNDSALHHVAFPIHY